MKPTFIEAIKEVYPNQYNWVNTDKEINWKDGHTTTNEELSNIENKLSELESDYNSKEYQRKRKAEYPTIEECVHAILDDDLDNLQALRTAVKEKYPK